MSLANTFPYLSNPTNLLEHFDWRYTWFVLHSAPAITTCKMRIYSYFNNKIKCDDCLINMVEALSLVIKFISYNMALWTIDNIKCRTHQNT